MSGDSRTFRLLYVSRIAPAALPGIGATLAEIDEVSRRANGECGITGLLLVAAGYFIQALEGEQSAVQAIFGDIRHDPRVLKPEISDMGVKPEAAFTRWSMCARGLSAVDTAIVDQIEKRRGFNPARLTPDALLALLKAIAQAQDGHGGPEPAIYL